MTRQESMNDVTTNKDRLDERIEQVEQLLHDLKDRKEELENGKPPAEHHPMAEHVNYAVRETGVSEDNIVYRTRRNGEKEASGLTKAGFVELNRFIAEHCEEKGGRK